MGNPGCADWLPCTWVCLLPRLLTPLPHQMLTRVNPSSCGPEPPGVSLVPACFRTPFSPPQESVLTDTLLAATPPHPTMPSPWLFLGGGVASETLPLRTSGPASSARELAWIPLAVLVLASGSRVPVDPPFPWDSPGVLNGAPQLWVALVSWNWAKPGDWPHSRGPTFIRRPCQLQAPVFTLQSPLFPPSAGAAAGLG